MADKELAMIAQSLHANVVDCMKSLMHASKQFGYYSGLTADDQRIEQRLFSHDENKLLSPELGRQLQRLFATEALQQTYGRRSEYWLLDSFPYCMQNLSRFCEQSFIPTEEDSVMARIRTTGIVVTELKHKIVQEKVDEPEYLCYQVVDVGGQRNERKKWYVYQCSICCAWCCLTMMLMSHH
jgi:hypothetical protein